ncbi:trimethylamine methyltransferase family protein [Anaerovorax sp. IOR16]|uniref:trimethylamine methyltransferase family protein n=1 Tax=Anaerovorax sp. IOR16 TaxID=2773458 RepID=UPI0019CFFF13|nr:trimethylamine methyltransferase family protein [Anaerovorax sp. IOR16]
MKKNKMEYVKKPSKVGVLRANTINDEQVDKIHFATLKILKDTGIRIGSLEAAKLFEKNGAEVEYKDEYAIVKLYPHMVEAALATAARPMTFYGRTKDKDFIAFKNNVGFTNFGETVGIIDLKTREHRDSVKADNGDLVKICDYYDEIAVVDRPFVCTDYPSSVQALHNLQVCMENTSKALFIGAANRDNCKRMIDMAAVAVGGMDNLKARPFLNIWVCPTSPLELAKECCEITMECAKAGIGIACIPMALAGATSPVTLAGSVVQHNAELLACFTLAQLVRKGARFIYCSMSTLMDLKTAEGAVGAPEQGILTSALSKIAQKYNLPTFMGSSLSDSKIPDAQVGYEFAMNAMAAAIAGVNFIEGAGALEFGLTMDYAKLVMDCEAMNSIRKIIGGIEVNDDTLALDIIDKVGPTGAYLNERHTFAYMKEQSNAEIFSRKSRSAWEKAGSKNVAEKAYEKAEWIS